MQCSQASVRPAEASSHTSAWTLLGHSRTGGISHEPVVQAGQELCVEAELRDAYGNMAGKDASSCMQRAMQKNT